jgi:DNA-binding beta-propeller fold protein YncE
MVGLAFDPTDGTLYGSAGGTLGPDRIYTIDKNTGAVALVGTTGLGGSTPDLFFDPMGNLYGSKGGGQSPDNTLISIDSATGAGSAIGPIGFRSVSGLAYALPEPGAILQLVSGAIGLAWLRKRRNRRTRPRR